MSDTFDIKAHRARAAKAWANKQQFDPLYRDAVDYTMPYRRSAKDGQAERRGDFIFDSSGMASHLRGAGKLQQDLFPPGQQNFHLKPGAIAKRLKRTGIGGNGGPPLDDATKEAQFSALENGLSSLTEQITPFLQTGAFDNAMSEVCIDLYVGDAAMLILQGETEQPLRFVVLPYDERAFEPGPYGDVGGLFWRTKMSRRNIRAAFPKGRFSDAFVKAETENADGEVDISHDFVMDGKGWRMIVTLAEDCDEPIVSQKYRTRPFIAPRYFRVPGEVNGRGPVMLALPTIKTLNKAMELVLKAAAIQLLGIWGYRPGGTFNPETSPLKPGAFWPMQATGGVMGADVTRLDARNTDVQLGTIILQELRTQIQAILHDEQLPNGGATPKSATEIMARMSRVQQNYVGAYGRMIYEVWPVLIPRVIEILYSLDLITVQPKIDQLLVSLDVISPLAQSLRADHYQMHVQAMQLCALIEGPQAVARRFKLDELMPKMIKDLGVDSREVRSVQELMVYDKQTQQQQSAATLTEAMAKKPEAFANIMGQTQEAQPA